MHLRMTGNLLLRAGPEGAAADLMHADRLGPARLYEAEPQLRFLRARLELDDGSELLFTDARRFGHARRAAGRRPRRLLRRAARDRAALRRADAGGAAAHLAAGRTAPLKSFLLNQDRVAGIGNIYADEALFRAELHPLSPAGSMRTEHSDGARRGDRRDARGRA